MSDRAKSQPRRLSKACTVFQDVPPQTFCLLLSPSTLLSSVAYPLPPHPLPLSPYPKKTTHLSIAISLYNAWQADAFQPA